MGSFAGGRAKGRKKKMHAEKKPWLGGSSLECLERGEEGDSK